MSVAKPYESATSYSGWPLRLRLFIANYGVYIALLALLLAAIVLTPRLLMSTPWPSSCGRHRNWHCRDRADADPVGRRARSVRRRHLHLTSIVVADVTNGRDELVIPAILIALALGALVGWATAYW